MGLFSMLFGRKKRAPASPLQRYIDENLPENYTQSRKYAVSLLESGRRAAAKITLDMLADGSDYTDFGDADYAQLAELESSYLLTGCLSKPPVPTDFTLDLVFSAGRVITVEKQAGQDIGFLTAQGLRKQITF